MFLLLYSRYCSFDLLKEFSSSDLPLLQDLIQQLRGSIPRASCSKDVWSSRRRVVTRIHFRWIQCTSPTLENAVNRNKNRVTNTIFIKHHRNYFIRFLPHDSGFNQVNAPHIRPLFNDIVFNRSLCHQPPSWDAMFCAEHFADASICSTQRWLLGRLPIRKRARFLQWYYECKVIDLNRLLFFFLTWMKFVFFFCFFFIRVYSIKQICTAQPKDFLTLLETRIYCNLAVISVVISFVIFRGAEPFLIIPTYALLSCIFLSFLRIFFRFRVSTYSLFWNCFPVLKLHLLCTVHSLCIFLSLLLLTENRVLIQSMISLIFMHTNILLDMILIFNQIRDFLNF